MVDRLIELIQDSVNGCARNWAEVIAKSLLANGVIVPPCKVGDTVWFNTYKKNATVCIGIQPHTVDRVDVRLVCGAKSLIPTEIHDYEIGKTIFLTKEEAERALKEREQG